MLMSSFRLVSSSSNDVMRKPLAMKNQLTMIDAPVMYLLINLAWSRTTIRTMMARVPSKVGQYPSFSPFTLIRRFASPDTASHPSSHSHCPEFLARPVKPPSVSSGSAKGYRWASRNVHTE